MSPPWRSPSFDRARRRTCLGVDGLARVLGVDGPWLADVVAGQLDGTGPLVARLVDLLGLGDDDLEVALVLARADR